MVEKSAPSIAERSFSGVLRVTVARKRRDVHEGGPGVWLVTLVEMIHLRRDVAHTMLQGLNLTLQLTHHGDQFLKLALCMVQALGVLSVFHRRDDLVEYGLNDIGSLLIVLHRLSYRCRCHIRLFLCRGPGDLFLLGRYLYLFRGGSRRLGRSCGGLRFVSAGHKDGYYQRD